MGFGPAEIVIVGLILLVLFGPTLVAFFVGYTLGKRKAAEAPPARQPAQSPTPSEAEPEAEASAPVEAPTPDLQEKQPDE